MIALVGPAFFAADCFAQGIFGRKHARTPCPGVTNVEELSALIDQLDAKLYRLGKVAVKSPDVWGQNRMTRYRAAFDQEMLKELDKFRVELQAYQRRSDSAALTSATAIGIAAQTPSPGGRPAVAPTTTTTNISVPTSIGIPDNLVDNAKDLIGKATPVLDTTSIAQLNLALSNYFGGIGLDPSIMLDEKADYIKHLQQLERINSGDDIADTPGYSLYLMRMPVSILPGPASERGKGAVVTVEAKHALSSDLLPSTFKKATILDATYILKEVIERVIHGESDLSEFMPYQDSKQIKSWVSVAGVGASFGGQSTLAEVVEILGPDNIRVLIDEIQNSDTSRSHEDSTVIGRLLVELSIAHDFLRDQARRGVADFSTANLFEIGNLALSRSYAALKERRRKFLIDLINAREGETVCPAIARESDQVFKRRIKAVDILVFALIVQSAFVDRKIKEDMEITARRSGCDWGDPWSYLFLEPYPSPEARSAFNAYVEKKWPIHVFSIDPSIDQQNELDAYSRRSELQLALAVAVATGRMNVRNATTYARRLEEDLETIGLNRTAVAFGAGETTFGWRFYPRIQSPPDPNNPQRFAGLLLFNGPGPNYDVKHRRIEPGARECVAAMLVPDFISSLRMTTVTGWFDLIGHHGSKTPDTTEMLRLGRMVQTARAGFRHLCDVGLYRPGDLERLNDRLAQLEALLPMQTYQVRLPFEGDLNGSDIFTSEGSGLAPRLLTYFGEPPQVGVDSAVFLLGTGFSVNSSKCIAGGVAVGLEPISRNVIRIVVPKNARSIKAKKLDIDGKARTLIDVHIATPNGISNHLYLVAKPADPVCGDVAASVGAPIAFDQTTTTLSFAFRREGSRNEFAGLGDAQTPILLRWLDPTNPPTKIKICLNFKRADGSPFQLAECGPLYLNPKDRGYAIGLNDLNRLAEDYLQKIGDDPIPLSTCRVEVRSIGETLDREPFATGNSLRFLPTEVAPSPLSIPPPPARAPLPIQPQKTGRGILTPKLPPTDGSIAQARNRPRPSPSPASSSSPVRPNPPSPSTAPPVLLSRPKRSSPTISAPLFSSPVDSKPPSSSSPSPPSRVSRLARSIWKRP